MPTSVDVVQLASLMERIRADAIEYYRLTGKPLGVTGEIAEYEVSRLLGLKLCDAREPGCDALRTRLGGSDERVQIKGRWFPAQRQPGARVGKVDMKHSWDSAILVLLDRDYRAAEMWEA